EKNSIVILIIFTSTVPLSFSRSLLSYNSSITIPLLLLSHFKLAPKFVRFSIFPHFLSQFLYPSRILTHTFRICAKKFPSSTSLHVERKSPWIFNPHLLFLIRSPLFTIHSFHFNLFSISRGKNQTSFPKKLLVLEDVRKEDIQVVCAWTVALEMDLRNDRLRISFVVLEQIKSLRTS
ncbi:hypothetical protein GIB67_032543, partial [Kingdonia uniflora]